MTAPVPVLDGQPPILAWYGDDFTGATDTLATLAQAGLRALLFLRVPTPGELSAVGTLDAIGIAGAARSMYTETMRAELRPVGEFFRQVGATILHYKMCSTFDSAPQKGNLYTAIKTLRDYVESGFVPIVGGQPNLGRYCVFSHLYAQAGEQGQVYRIDRHPTMSRHPVTPMHEADLGMHLAEQGLKAVGSMHYPQYCKRAWQQDAELEAQRAQLAKYNHGLQAVLFDVAREADLAHIGRMIWDEAKSKTVLAVGASSVARSLLAHWGCEPRDEHFVLKPAIGPVFVFAGSLSPVTLRQVRAASLYRQISMSGTRLLDDVSYRRQQEDEVISLLSEGENVLVFTNTSEQERIDVSRAARVAEISADFVARIVQRMARTSPLSRVGIAGGDTSSQVTQALGVWGLSYLCTLSPGVTVSQVHSHTDSTNGIELMLKGGQVGSEDLFDRFAAR